MQSIFSLAFQEVMDLHIQIENLYNNRTSSEERLPLLSYFHPDFTMITPNGVLRDFTWFKHWYENAMGTRPNVKIHIENFKENFFTADLVIVNYEEFQQVTPTEALRGSVNNFVKPALNYE